MMLSNVGFVSFISCLFAPSTTSPTGMPLASTRRLRFVPDLRLSVGFGPVDFSPKRRLGHRRVNSLPPPIKLLLGVVRRQSRLPELFEDACFTPFLEAVVDCAWCAEASGQRLPLASCSEDVEDRVHR